MIKCYIYDKKSKLSHNYTKSLTKNDFIIMTSSHNLNFISVNFDIILVSNTILSIFDELVPQDLAFLS